MPNLRGILTVSIPVVSVIFGFLWYFGRKRPKQKDEDETEEKLVSAVANRNDQIPSNVRASNAKNESEASSSPCTSRKRKASQISRSEDVDHDGDDSVEEEMEGAHDKLSHVQEKIISPSSVTSVDAALNTSQTDPNLVLDKDVISKNSSTHDEQSNCTAVNETILVSDKSAVLNEAFVTTGISEQSILNEKELQGKIEDLSLSTSKIEEPLLESTMIDNLNSQSNHMTESDINDLSSRLESSVSLASRNHSSSVKDTTLDHQSSSDSSAAKITSPKRILSREDKTNKNVNRTEVVESNCEKKSSSVVSRSPGKSAAGKDHSKNARPQDRKPVVKSKETSPDVRAKEVRSSTGSKEGSPEVGGRRSHRSGGSDYASDNGVLWSDCSNDNNSEVVYSAEVEYYMYNVTVKHEYTR